MGFSVLNGKPPIWAFQYHPPCSANIGDHRRYHQTYINDKVFSKRFISALTTNGASPLAMETGQSGRKVKKNSVLGFELLPI